MLEEILADISTLTPFWIYISLFFFAYIENLFPPSPSDLAVVIGGSLIGADTIYFIPTLIIVTTGSLSGFMTAFLIGKGIDKRLLHSGKIKFINIEAVEKAEAAFRKYGYFLIIANRFLPGTRAVISFFAGISNLDTKKTATLGGASAFVWNLILLILGIVFAHNIELIDSYLKSYSKIVIVITVVIVILLVIKSVYNKLKKK